MIINIIVQVQCCFTSTETVPTIRDGEPRTVTSTFTLQLMSSDYHHNCIYLIYRVGRNDNVISVIRIFILFYGVGDKNMISIIRIVSNLWGWRR